MRDTFHGDYGTATVSESKRPAVPAPLEEARAALTSPFDVEAVRDFRGETLPHLLPYPLTVVVWGMETKSEQNERGHWAPKARRAKKQKEAVAAALFPHRNLLLAVGGEVNDHGAGLTIRLTRIGPRRFDSDGAVAALKAVRDAVADALGVNDGCPRLAWLPPSQRRGEPGVVIEIETVLRG